MDTTSRKNVLVVDADAKFRSKMTKVLSKHGCYVVTAKAHDSAIEIIETELPDVVLVDPFVPGINIEEIHQKARVAKPTVKLYLTAGHPTSRFQIIRKPITEIVLLNTIGGCDNAA